MEKCFKLNAAKKFFDILSGSEFVAFLGYGNEVEAFAKNLVLVKMWWLNGMLDCWKWKEVDRGNLRFPGVALW